MAELAMRTRTVELPGGKHLRLAVVDGDSPRAPVLALTRSTDDDGIGAMLEPEAPQLVLPAACIADLVEALEELGGGPS